MPAEGRIAAMETAVVGTVEVVFAVRLEQRRVEYQLHKSVVFIISTIK